MFCGSLRSPTRSVLATEIVPAFVSLSVMLVTLEILVKDANALRFVVIFAAVSLMTVPAGISPVNANNCAAVIGGDAVEVAARSFAVAGGDIATVELFFVLMVGVIAVVVVFTTGVLPTAVELAVETV